jgi:hypothetical protein
LPSPPTVPGVFSAYRYIAIQNEKSGEDGPLYKHFLSEKNISRGGELTADMYLAEDRILAWGPFLLYLSEQPFIIEEVLDPCEDTLPVTFIFSSLSLMSNEVYIYRETTTFHFSFLPPLWQISN